jgi:cation transport ATPase
MNTFEKLRQRLNGNDQDQHHSHAHAHAGDANRVTDPVCGMEVDPRTSKHSLLHEGHDQYFCSAACKAKFEADPARYLAKYAGMAAAQAAEATIWTCPMHPEIRRDKPGSCPICGMALEPLLVTAESGPSPELTDMTRRFWIGLALAAPVFVLEMGGHLFPALHHVVPTRTSILIQLVLATPVVLWCGWPFFERAWASLVNRSLNMFTLIVMGTGIAWTYSVVAALAPGIFPAAFRAADGTVAVYFEAAAVITVLVLLGQVLELRARERTSDAIKALLDLAPKTARRIRDDGVEEDVPIEAVALSDRLRVALARLYRLTVSWRTDAPRSTRRWSRANPCPSPVPWVIRSSAAR